MSTGFIKDVQKGTYIKVSNTTKRRTNIINKENIIGDKMIEYNENIIITFITRKFNPIIYT